VEQGTAHLHSGHNLLRDSGSGAAASGHAGHTVDRTKELGTVDLPHISSAVSNTQAKHLARRSLSAGLSGTAINVRPCSEHGAEEKLTAVPAKLATNTAADSVARNAAVGRSHLLTRVPARRTSTRKQQRRMSDNKENAMYVYVRARAQDAGRSAVKASHGIAWIEQRQPALPRALRPSRPGGLERLFAPPLPPRLSTAAPRAAHNAHSSHADGRRHLLLRPLLRPPPSTRPPLAVPFPTHPTSCHGLRSDL
jgi:hypothetical protein